MNAQPSMRFGIVRYPIVKGARAEVEGITSKGLLGHNQRGTLLVTVPGRKTQALRLPDKRRVSNGLVFAAQYNAACDAAPATAPAQSAGPRPNPYAGLHVETNLPGHA